MSTNISDRFTPGFWRSSWDDIRLAWNLLRDPRVPFVNKLIPAIAILYIFSPFDIALDFIPILGQLDDVAVVLLGAKLFVRSVPEALVLEHKNKLT